MCVKWNCTITGLCTQFLVRTADPSTSGSCLFIDLYVSFHFLGRIFPSLLSECHCLALLQWFYIVAHGNWSPWSGWGICSRSCNGGQMRRYRTCDNPRPSNGGRACGGPDSQIQKCNTDMCPGELPDSCSRSILCSVHCSSSSILDLNNCINRATLNTNFRTGLFILTIPFLFTVDGSWGNWQSWGPCSASCGGGEKTRKRLCNNPEPSNRGRPCPGDATQVSRCNIHACPGKQVSEILAELLLAHLQPFCKLRKGVTLSPQITEQCYLWEEELGKKYLPPLAGAALPQNSWLDFSLCLPLPRLPCDRIGSAQP